MDDRRYSQLFGHSRTEFPDAEIGVDMDDVGLERAHQLFEPNVEAGKAHVSVGLAQVQPRAPDDRIVGTVLISAVACQHGHVTGLLQFLCQIVHHHGRAADQRIVGVRADQHVESSVSRTKIFQQFFSVYFHNPSPDIASIIT